MANRYLCGVPKDECCGAAVQSNNSLGKSCKAHGTSEQAFNCYKAWLLRQGYTKVGEREFVNPKTGFITLLNKKSHFGTRLRPGKTGEKTASGNRFVPISVGAMNRAGAIT